MSRVGEFDRQIRRLATLGCEEWEHLTPENRTRLVRLFFEETPEWGDALFDDMAPVLDAFEHHDDADFGLAVRQKMVAYVRPYVNKQLAYVALCRREDFTGDRAYSDDDEDARERFEALQE